MYSTPCRSFYANKEYYEEYSKQLLTNTLYTCLGLNNYGFVVNKPLVYTFAPNFLEDLPESLYKRRDILKGTRIKEGAIRILDYSSASNTLCLEFDLILESKPESEEIELNEKLFGLLSYYLPDMIISKEKVSNRVKITIESDFPIKEEENPYEKHEENNYYA